MFKPIYLIIGKWLGIIGAVLLVLFRVRQSGKDAERHKVMRDTLEGVRIRDKIENDVATSDTHSLRKKWER